jgi:hypothetical protein
MHGDVLSKATYEASSSSEGCRGGSVTTTPGCAWPRSSAPGSGS